MNSALVNSAVDGNLSAVQCTLLERSAGKRGLATVPHNEAKNEVADTSDSWLHLKISVRNYMPSSTELFV